MYEAFDRIFVPTAKPERASMVRPQDGSIQSFRACYGGLAFRQGLYRTAASADVEAWRERAIDAFPDFATRLLAVFGYDWLGRAFGLDNARIEVGQPAVLMLEPGTGEALELPCNLVSFHDGEIVNYQDAALAADEHRRWIAAGGLAPSATQAVGYKRPLFLGGKDELTNLELVDLDVYWSLQAQLLAKVRRLPPGSPIKIKLDA